MAGKSLGDIYTQGSFSGKSAGSMSLDYLDTVFQKESGANVWEIGGPDTWSHNYFETDESGDWAYQPDSLGREDLFWEYDLTKEKNIGKMYDRKMDSLSGTIDKMFRTTKENLNKTSINIGKTNLISGKHLEERKAISEEAGIKLTKTKSDISIDAIKTDMKVQNLRKKYESDILDTSEELGYDADKAIAGLPNIITSGDVGKYSLKKGSSGDEITMNGQTYRWKNYDTVFKLFGGGQIKKYGWVLEGTSTGAGSDDVDWF